LSATNSFSVVVGDFLELSLGSTAVRAGQSGSVPVTMNSSAGITNVSFLLQAPDERLTDFAPQLLPPDVSGSAQPSAPNRSLIRYDAVGGQPLIGTRSLSSLAFTASSNQTSAFVPLNVSGLAAVQGNGVPVPRTISNDGRIAIVGTAPLLEALIRTNGQRTVILYGIPQMNYTLESTTSLADGVSWTIEWQGMLTNLFQVFDMGTTNQTIFYRAKE